MDEVGVARSAAGRLPERPEHQRQQERPGWVPAQVANDTGSVRDPVMADGRRRDHLDVHPALADALDGVGHEPPRRVDRRPRIRAREDRDLHTTACSRRPKTTGRASTSMMNP